MSTLKTRVTYFEPGIFFSKMKSVILTDYTLEELAKQAPARAFCFVVEQYEESSRNVWGLTFKSSKQVGDLTVVRHYLGGKAYSFHELTRVLKKHLPFSGFDHPRMIKCRTGNWQPFRYVDMIID